MRSPIHRGAQNGEDPLLERSLRVRLTCVLFFVLATHPRHQNLEIQVAFFATLLQSPHDLKTSIASTDHRRNRRDGPFILANFVPFSCLRFARRTSSLTLRQGRHDGDDVIRVAVTRQLLHLVQTFQQIEQRLWYDHMFSLNYRLRAHHVLLLVDDGLQCRVGRAPVGRFHPTLVHTVSTAHELAVDDNGVKCAPLVLGSVDPILLSRRLNAEPRT
mmetsp:Transcript_25947/g.68041  ORF Transcript_25947/g.68041 Transcript_25947/m.68041 type:complete len:216 (+) Transcript_25947:908-1555(+)